MQPVREKDGEYGVGVTKISTSVIVAQHWGFSWLYFLKDASDA